MAYTHVLFLGRNIFRKLETNSTTIRYFTIYNICDVCASIKDCLWLAKTLTYQEIDVFASLVCFFFPGQTKSCHFLKGLF